MPEEEELSTRELILTYLPILAPIAAAIGAIWYVAIWTSDLQNKAEKTENRIAFIEKRTEEISINDTKISQLQFRLNWMDEEKNRDRNERKQIDRDIRDALDKLSAIVIRLEYHDPYAKRRR